MKTSYGQSLPRHLTHFSHTQEASPVTQMVKNLPAMRETQVQSLNQEDSPGEGHSNPLQYSCLENPVDRRAWRVTVRGVTKNWTGLSN